jgi:Mannosyl-glycoprotein endo-beta-N-acetylglucosaminidase
MKKFLLILTLGVMACSFTGETKKNKVPKVPQVAMGDTLTVENLISTVWTLPFRHKNIIIAQAILETGWFKSDNCVNNNNLFGMKKSFSRVSTYDTIINGYAHYSNWKMSVVDYYLLQSTRESIIRTSKDEYMRYLNRTYSEVGSSYSRQLEDIIKRLDLPKEWDETIKPKTKKNPESKKRVIQRKTSKRKF